MRPFCFLAGSVVAASLIGGAAAFCQPLPLAVYELERQSVRPVAVASTSDWDARWYEVRLRIFPTEQKIRGEVRIRLASRRAGIQRLRLDLVALDAEFVYVDGEQVPFSRRPGYLEVALPEPISAGDSILVRVAYQGRPGNDGFGGFFFTPKAIYTIGEGIYTYPPSMTRTWLSCRDHPSDKALFELWASVPAPLVVASNGVLVERFGGDTLTFHWRSAFPMATYLFALAAGEYDTLLQRAVFASGDTLPIVNYVYPARKEAARRDFENVPRALELFSQLFGPYPFERYGAVIAPCRGAMEHQTLSTISDALVDGSRRYETVFVHELAHQWWGDLVTLQDWPDLWLNEGFASYGEVLFAEHRYGEAAKRSMLDYFARKYFAEEARLGAFAVYNPPARYMWGATVYHKGAWILHMLRFVVGDSAFFRLLRSYRDRYAYGNASTRDFQAVAEEVAGVDLDWFFDEWLYRAGHPVLLVDWEQTSPERVELVIEQVQYGAPAFEMPVVVEMAGANWSQRDTVRLTSCRDRFLLSIRDGPATVDSLVVDPDGNLLAEIRTSVGSSPEEFALEGPFPNPARLRTIFRIRWGRRPPSELSLSIYDVLGRRVRTLLERSFYGNSLEVMWDGRDDRGEPVPGGVYVAVLRSGGKVRTQKIVWLPR